MEGRRGCSGGWFIAIVLVAVVLTVFVAATRCFIARDCGWNHQVVVWLDMDADGVRDEDEVPMPGVVVHAEEVNLGYLHGAQPVNWQGEYRFDVFLSGCPDVSFEVYPEVPEGYRVTTAARVKDPDQETDSLFGLTYVAGAPTATPRPPDLWCEAVFSAESTVRHVDLTDVQVMPDGAAMASTYGDGIYRIDLRREPSAIRFAQFGSYVKGITLGPNGTLWVASDSGAHRYDGYEIRRVEPGTGLVGGRVTDIALDPSGAVWLATQQGVSRLDPDTDTWRNYTAEDGLGEGSVMSIAAGPDGSIWASTLFGGVSRLGPPDGSGVRSVGRAVEGLSCNEIQVAPDGTTWLGCNDGLHRLDPGSGTWISYGRYSTGGEFDGSSVYEIALAPDGTLWLAVSDAQPVVYRFTPGRDGQGDVWRKYYVNTTVEETSKAVSLAGDGAIWVASRRTVWRCTFPEQ